MAINAKKAKLYNSRNIKTQLGDSSFVNKERLNIPDFLQSREFEIRSFEISQLKTKKSSATRVFQSLPRVLRRRAASHNVKRVPKRLRKRALSEMENSVNGVPPKKEHLRGRQLYRLRMRKSLLKLGAKLKLMRQLPGEEFYNHKLNLREKIKLLNEEIKQIESRPVTHKTDSVKKSTITVNNTLGSYDNTGINAFAPKPKGSIKFHKRQHKYTWLPTHIWHTKRFHMIKQYGYQIPLTPTQKCFRLMNRQKRSSTVLTDSSYLNSMVIEIQDESEYNKFLFDLVRPSKRILPSILNGAKSYNSWIHLNDRSKIGKALVYSNIQHRRILIRVHPSIFHQAFQNFQAQISKFASTTSIHDCSYSLGSLELVGPTSINSLSKVFHLFKDQDKDLQEIWSGISRINDSGIIPVGTTLSFDIKDPRFWKKPVNLPTASSKTSNDIVIQLSQWKSNIVNSTTINSLLSPHGRNESYKNQQSIKSISQKFGQVKDSSNSIHQTFLETSRIPLLVTKVSKSSWTVILPWYWVLPLWIKMIGVTNIKTGGIKQLQQFNFEDDLPTYPQDYPYLKEGARYNFTLGELTKEKFERLSANLQNKSRPDFNDDDRALVSPFKCDWNGLRNLVNVKKLSGLSDKQLSETKPTFGSFDETNLSRNIKSYNDIMQVASRVKDSQEIAVELYDKDNSSHQAYMNDTQDISKGITSMSLPIVQVSIETLKDGVIKDGARIYSSEHSQEEHQPWSFIYLAGFVSSGAYNLSKGKYTGIGAVESRQIDKSEVYIRNLGCTKLYRASIKVIN